MRATGQGGVNNQRARCLVKGTRPPFPHACTMWSVAEEEERRGNALLFNNSCVLDKALFNKKSIQDIGNNMQPHPVSLRCQVLIRHSPKYRTDVLFQFYLLHPQSPTMVTRCRACTSAGVALCLKPNFSRQNIRPFDHLKKVFFACPSAVLSRLKWT